MVKATVVRGSSNKGRKVRKGTGTTGAIKSTLVLLEWQENSGSRVIKELRAT